MITKGKFTEIMNHLRDRDDISREILQVHLNYKIPVTEAKFACPRDFGIEEIVLDLLVDIFRDDQELISVWIVDGDYGRNLDGRKFFCNNKEVDLDTPEKLYDLLLDFYGRIEAV